MSTDDMRQAAKHFSATFVDTYGRFGEPSPDPIRREPIDHLSISLRNLMDPAKRSAYDAIVQRIIAENKK